MKPTTRIFFNSAAGVIGACSVHAADLPSAKAGYVQYLQVCAIHGPGFFYIPDTDTCVKVGGRVRFESVVFQASNQATDPLGFHAHGRLAIDSRTQTDWGLLRAYMRINIGRNSGNPYFGSLPLQAAAYTFGFAGGAAGFPSFAGADAAFKLTSGVFISAAAVQWGGLTAGRIQSFFDFYADNDTWFGITDSDIITQALAYTYTFGAGFSATLSIEDPKERQRYPIAGTGAFGTGTIFPNSVPKALISNYANYAINYPRAANPLLSGFGPLAATGFSQGENVPDLVGNIRVDQAWGSAQLSANWHHLSTSGSVTTGLNASGVNAVAGGFSVRTGNGWAVQGGAKLNLPMITAGDYLYLQAAYARGEFSAVDSGFSAPFLSTGLSVGGTTFSAYDAVLGPSGKVTLTPAYSAMFSLEHYWVPTLRSGFFGGVAHINYSPTIRRAEGYAEGAACPTCLDTITNSNGALYNPYSPFYDAGNAYSIGSNLIWSPVEDLDIGVEVSYRRNQMQHKEYNSNLGYPNLIREDDTFWYRLRISREF
ncbi:MAG: porin [Acidobacteriaceae bacterium]|nr:porin [Acidobacteriaceae bacterium]